MFKISNRPWMAMIASLILASGSFVPGTSAANRFSEPTTEQKIDQIVSVFENATPELQYSYIEALGDGRGYTAGRSGFTTANEDLLQVVETYEKKSPQVVSWPQLQALLPRLRQLSSQQSGSIKGLEDLPAAWVASSDDPLFRQSQDEVTEELYKVPARRYCQELGLKTALSFLVIYDTIIQHGNGDDDDSIGALIGKTKERANEEAFIRAFLDIRRADLMNPSDSGTAAEWRESVDRVDALKRLVNSGSWDLASPLRLEVWGNTYAF